MVNNVFICRVETLLIKKIIFGDLVMNRKLKIFICLIIVTILALISVLSCRNIYGELTYVEDGSGKERLDANNFPNYYLTEQQQQTPYIQGPTIVFDSRGGNNTQIYHIPAIIVADNGNIIAFGDNRHQRSVDIGFTKGGLIDIVYKISKDGGKTWSAEKIIKPISTSDDIQYTRNKGDVSVFKCLSGKLVALAVSGGGFANGHNPATPSRMLRSKSYDNGETWTPWEEVGQNTVFKVMKSRSINRGFATSGRGTTLSSGRLATAMVGSTTGNLKNWVAYYLYSDDEGETWKVYQNMKWAKGDDLLSEPKIIGELDNTNHLLMTVRNGNSSAGKQGRPRMYGYSTDGGMSWGNFDSPSSGKLGTWNNMLCGNVDSEGIVWTREGREDKTRILHLLTGPIFRRGMSFWVSENKGRSFVEKLKVLGTSHNPGKYTAGYNSIDVLGDGTIVTLAEEYNESNTKLGTADYDLVFRRYNMKAITGEVYKTNWYKSVTNKYITE